MKLVVPLGLFAIRLRALLQRKLNRVKSMKRLKIIGPCLGEWFLILSFRWWELAL